MYSPDCFFFNADNGTTDNNTGETTECNVGVAINWIFRYILNYIM